MENRQNKPPEGGAASGHGGQKFHTDSEQAKLHKSKLRMESREERLNKARERLANQKPPKKPGPIKRIARIAGHETHAFLHGKVYQEEAELSRVSDLMAAVVQYAKTRPAFDGYKAAKYNRKYLAEHEAELADYRAAKATMAELLGGEKLPKMDVLKEKRRQLAARKKALYLEYRKAQQDMRELVAVKGSVDHLRGLTDSQRNKEQAC